mmetsp:Transcript_5777/g.10220  ORF Transcript_5777/g.10220 Transcript_5777/m.10220 type:complete len:80 (+) Transcript_5777:1321-1560(+)
MVIDRVKIRLLTADPLEQSNPGSMLEITRSCVRRDLRYRILRVLLAVLNRIQAACSMSKVKPENATDVKIATGVVLKQP